MTGLQIRGLLLTRGYTMSRAADEIGVSINMVAMVVNRQRTSARVRRWIADKLGLSVNQIWPQKAS